MGVGERVRGYREWGGGMGKDYERLGTREGWDEGRGKRLLGNGEGKREGVDGKCGYGDENKALCGQGHG